VAIYPEQNLYEIVLSAQQRDRTSPTRQSLQLYSRHSRSRNNRGLVELGILKGEIDKLIEEEKYKPFYMHRHWLGLMSMWASTNTASPLQPGQVLTVEPGLYIVPTTKPAEDQPEIDSWSGIGIRIEDDVLVKPQGMKC